MLPLSNEIHNYINSLPKANPLTKAIERKYKIINMGTSQSHNLKSSPNWSAAKRAMTSLANGTDNKSESNAKFLVI